MTQHRRAAALCVTAPRTDLLKEYRLNDTDSDYLSLPHGTDINFDRTDSFTYAAYIKFDTAAMGAYAGIGSKRAATGPGWQFFKTNLDRLQFFAFGSTQAITVTGSYFTVTANEWHLMVLVYNGVPAETRFYYDGKDDTMVVTANSLTSQSITNSAGLVLGTRLNSPFYSDMQFGRVSVYNRALTVNEIPDKLWNYGKPQLGNIVSGCVRDYNFINDVFSTNYIVKGNISGANGASVNMSGVELVSMNSVMVPAVTGAQASPFTTLQNFIGWDSAGLNVKYDVEVSDNGTTGWTVLATNIANLSYIHTVGTANTQKFYRIRAKGVGTTGTYSDVVDATTLDTGYEDVFYYNTRRLGDNSYDFGLSVETQRCAPQGYYDSISDKTYFCFMSRAEQGYDMATMAYYYDHPSGTFSDPKYVGLKTRQGLDRHPIPAIIVADDGHILVACTDFHNAPMQIYRSDNPGSIDSFTRLGEHGVITDYPEFRKFSNGDIAIFCRFYDTVADPDQAGMGVFLSTDDGLTFGSMIRIVQYQIVGGGRPYPMLMPQTEASDRIHILATPRNPSGGPFPGDPDKLGYFKDYGYAYADYLTDGVTVWRNAANSFNKDVSSVAITEAQWIANYLYLDSIGTNECGLPVGVVTAAGIPFIIAYDDSEVYKCHYWNGSSWTHQTITWSDEPPMWDADEQAFAFGYHGVQAIIHRPDLSSTTFDIYCTDAGIVKHYRTTDNFANATLQDGNFLPDVDGLLYERGTTTWNIYQAAEPFIFYSIKKSVPTPDPTSPGAWSDIVFKKLW